MPFTEQDLKGGNPGFLVQHHTMNLQAYLGRLSGKLIFVVWSPERDLGYRSWPQSFQHTDVFVVMGADEITQQCRMRPDEGLGQNSVKQRI